MTEDQIHKEADSILERAEDAAYSDRMTVTEAIAFWTLIAERSADFIAGLNEDLAAGRGDS